MRVIFDAAFGTLTVDDSTARSWGADIEACVNTYGQTIPLTGAEFGAEITIAGNTQRVRWPSNFVKTDQFVIASHRVLWRPEDTVELEAWIRSPRVKVAVAHNFTVPRPAKPFASWSWDSATRTWQAPVSPPDGEAYWDEDSLGWVEA